MCFAAVKFGRMSKKQREKVEDEVRYHRAAQQRAQQVEIPDTTISSYNEGHQTPSSTDPHIFPAGYVSALSPTNYLCSAFNLSVGYTLSQSLKTYVIYHIYRDDRVIIFSSRSKRSLQWSFNPYSDIKSLDETCTEGQLNQLFLFLFIMCNA